jgi:hypothetical protein
MPSLLYITDAEDGINIYQTTQCYIPKGGNLHSHHCESHRCHHCFISRVSNTVFDPGTAKAVKGLTVIFDVDLLMDLKHGFLVTD